MKRIDKKTGRFIRALTNKQRGIIKRWIKSGQHDFNRLQGKIMLHFGVSQNTARKELKELLHEKD